MSGVRPISKATASAFTWRDVFEGWTLVEADTLHVIQERMPPNTFELRHVHQTTRQFYFVLEGSATAEVDGVEHLIRPGEGIEIPPGSRHQMRNDSPTTVEFMVISSQPPRSDRVDVQQAP